MAVRDTVSRRPLRDLTTASARTDALFILSCDSVNRSDSSSYCSFHFFHIGVMTLDRLKNAEPSTSFVSV